MPTMSLRLILVGLSALAAVALAAFLPLEQAKQVVQHGTYWLLLFTLIVVLAYAWRHFRENPPGPLRPSRDTLIALGVILACGTFLVTREATGFRILADELILLGVSQNLHYERLFAVPARAYELQGSFVMLESYLDKRPGTFAFLLSLVHDLTGYRPANVFWLNAGLTYVFLGLLYVVARRIAGVGGGIVAVLLMTGLPLLAYNASGGGFEILNLIMILAVMLAGFHYVERPDATRAVLLVYLTILLAQTRYESGLYCIAAILLLAWGWWRVKQFILPWPLIIAPLLLISFPLQHRAVRDSQFMWQLPEELSSPFSFGFMPDNLGHALNFLFDIHGDQPGFMVLSVLGLVALVFFVALLVRRPRYCWVDPQGRPAGVLACVGVVLLANFVLLMCYHWGQLDKFEVGRLGLPFLLLLTLAVVAVVQYFKPTPLVWRWLALGVIIGMLGFTVPTLSGGLYGTHYVAHRETAWAIDIIDHYEKPAVFAYKTGLLPITREKPGVSMRRLYQRPLAVRYHLEKNIVGDFIVFERFVYRPELGGFAYAEDQEKLNEVFVMEPLAIVHLTPLHTLQASRIKAVKPLEEWPPELREKVESGEAEFDIPWVLPPESSGYATYRYLREFAQQLP